MPTDAVADRAIVLLGCGKMGSALLEGWLSRGTPPSSFTVIDPRPSDRLRSLSDEGLRLNLDLPDRPAVAVIAVKPQMMESALPGLRKLGGGDCLFVSIAAGTSLAALAETLGPATPIIRAMPNTPAAIGRGVTALVGNEHAGEDAMRLAESLLAAVGQTVRLESEALMDAVTAVSGSGPAYVFLLIEALAAAGVSEGLPPELALDLARATVSGAGQLAEKSPEAPGQLRENVTSPAGTTASALGVLMHDEDGLTQLMRRAVAAAAARSRELAG